MKATTEKRTRWKRLGWFVVIWLLGVVAISVVGYGLRMFIDSIYGGGS